MTLGKVCHCIVEKIYFISIKYWNTLCIRQRAKVPAAAELHAGALLLESWQNSKRSLSVSSGEISIYKAACYAPRV